MQKEIEMVSQHLTKIKNRMINKTICAFCGKTITQGEKTKKIFSSCFTDYKLLKYTSNYLCVGCISCMNGKSFNGKALRNFNLLITNKGINIIKYSNIYNIIKNTPKEDFILQISFAYKKHCFTYYKINKKNTNVIAIATDKGSFLIDKKIYLFYFDLVHSLYSFGFKKQEIENGEFSNLAKIEKFGAIKFFEIIKKLNIIKNTILFNLILLTLNKGESND